MGKPSTSRVVLPVPECIGAGRERREVKHLSTGRRRYSVSSGERKRRRLNRARATAGRRCASGVVGPA